MSPAMKASDRRIESVVSRLRRRQLVGSHKVGIEIVQLLWDVVDSAEMPTFEDLLVFVDGVGKRLQAAGRKEPVVQNIVLRILKFLREEYTTALNSHIDALVSQFTSPSLDVESSRRAGSEASGPLSKLHHDSVETPFSPYPIVPMDTSADFSSRNGALARQTSGYPWIVTDRAETNSGDNSTDATPEGDSMQKLSQSTSTLSLTDTAARTASSTSATSLAAGFRPTGTTSILQLLGHREIDPEDILAAPDTISTFQSTSLNGSPQRMRSPSPVETSPSAPTHPQFSSMSSEASPSEGGKPSIFASRSTGPPRNKSVVLLQQMVIKHEMAIPFQGPAVAHPFPGLMHRQSSVSVSNTVTARVRDAENEYSRKWSRNRRIFTDAIEEVLEELVGVRDRIAEQAKDHIHSAEIILTLGHSQTVEAFLKAAAKKRKITVVVAETAPSLLGRQMASALTTAGIPTLLVPDSSVYALMSRISKVILGTHIVRADGSLMAITGSLPICRAAKCHLVPVIVCTGMFKVSNEFGFDAATSAALDECDNGSPADILRLGNRDGPNDTLGEEKLEGRDLEVVSPYWDKVPQELISLFITNIGAHPSSMIFRLLKEQLFE